jgi:hypothetical protein
MRKILFAYERNAEDISVQSGRPHSILAGLRERASIDNFSPLNQSVLRLFQPINWVYDQRGQVYRGDRERLYLRWLAQQVERRAAARRCDAVFSPGSLAISLLKSDRPIFFCADAPFGVMVDFYNWFTNLSSRYRACGFEQEAEAHARCAAAIYPSQWAADGGG